MKKQLDSERKNLLGRSALINVVGKYSYVIVYLLYTAILSRLLSPEEFGIVAVITIFTSFFTIVSQIGIGPAIVQKKSLTSLEHQHIFSYTILIALIVSVLFSIFSVPISLLFRNSNYIYIGALLSISLFFSTLNIVPLALLQKKHQFFIINKRNVLVALIAAIPSIISAYFGFSFYSLIIYSILIQLFLFFWNFKNSNLKIKLNFDFNAVKKIRDFSRYQFWFNLINYFSRNLDNLLIGYFLGETRLGYYDKSYKLMTYPTNYLTHAITPVLHPIFSKYKNDFNYVFDNYIKILKVLSLLGVYVTAIVFFNSDEIILILYGNQWIYSSTSLRFLSLSIWSQMLISTTGSIYQSFDKTKLLMLSGLISMIVIASGIISGLFFGNINYISIFVSISYILIFIKDFYILFRFVLKTNLRILINNIKYDLFLMVIIFIIMFLIKSNIEINNIYLSFALNIILISIIYVVGLIKTNNYKFLKELIYKNLFTRN